MWTIETGGSDNCSGRRCPSDLTAFEWDPIGAADLASKAVRRQTTVELGELAHGLRMGSLLGRHPVRLKLHADGSFPAAAEPEHRPLPPKRRIVGLTTVRLDRSRRPARDWERLHRNALACLRWSSIRLRMPKAPSGLCHGTA